MSFLYRTLTLEDLAAIEQIQIEVCSLLDDPNILQPLSRTELTNILNGNGVMLGIFKEGSLIAFRALLKPAVNEDEHLGVDVGASNLSRVLYQEISIVHPNYRGQNLQKRMAQYILEQVDLSEYDWMCATVMPYNIASLKDKFAQGMKIFALKLKYGGKLRYVFGKRLRSEEEHYTEQVLVPMCDTEEQQRLITNGFIGVNMQFEHEDWYVKYVK